MRSLRNADTEAVAAAHPCGKHFMPEGHPDRIAAAVSEVLRRTASSRAVTPCEQPEFERDRLPLIHPGDECEHLRDIDRLARPRAEACEECGMERTLRVCLSCGHVGCCESWRGHASAHAEETGHPVIAAWRGGAFAYCYPHRRDL